jgi:hypothetical protein
MTDQDFERKEKARLDAMYDAHYSDEPTYQTEYSDKKQINSTIQARKEKNLIIVDLPQTPKGSGGISKPIEMVPSKKVLSIIVLVYYAIVALVCVYFAWIALSAVKPELPCSVSEISPDFSNADREKCRVIRNHKL